MPSNLKQTSAALLRSLKDYNDALKDHEEREKQKPDPDFETARDKVHEAESLLRQSGLSDALGDKIPNVIGGWFKWMKEGVFRHNPEFRASEIMIEREVRGRDRKPPKTDVVRLRFNETDYEFTLADNGLDFMGETRRGSLSLAMEGKQLVIVSIVGGQDDWRYCGVEALRVGEWMKDVLEMASQIRTFEAERSKRWRMESLSGKAENIVLE